MTIFSQDGAQLGRAFDRAWALISDEYGDALIDIEMARNLLAQSVLAAGDSPEHNETALVENALADFRANYSRRLAPVYSRARSQQPRVNG